MPKLTTKLSPKGIAALLEQPVGHVEPCPRCDTAAARDEKLLDALQTARYALNGVDGIRDAEVKLARARAAVDEALKLMQPKRW